MGSFKVSLLLSLLTFLLLTIVTAGDDLGTYVIHVQPQEDRHFGTTDHDRKAWHQSFLPEHGHLLHSYHHVASGFAARLTRRELEAVSAMPGFVAAGNGTASGIAPRAHLAMYKVCDENGDCAGVDVLAGIDAAVSDGCDVISMSLGLQPRPFYNDSVAIGTFAAAEKGTFVSMAAGNGGPRNSSILNEAPWMLTVAASTMDRLISAKVILGDNLSFDGESLYQPDNSVEASLVYAGASSTHLAQFCGNGSLDGFDVKDKIVLCDVGGYPPVDMGAEVLRAGGAGMIVGNQFLEGYITFPDAHVLPASQVSYAAVVKIKNYINSTTNPTATISFRGTVLGTSPAPVITYFSSRGPCVHSPGILKPDITGPGVNVITAWPFQVGPPSIDIRPTFNIISGTSMSTPHLAGVAALIKSKHPSWSPAAIKSAIMTTADVTDRSGTPILDEQHKAADLFAVGAGHVNPEKAVDPGLIFDISPDDYIGYLCGMYKSEEVSVIARRAVNCSADMAIPDYQLNYPSVSALFPPTWSSNPPMSAERTVMNVGEVPALYYPEVDMPADSPVIVTVISDKLLFTEANQVQKFDIDVEAKNSSSTAVQGAIRWVSVKHTVVSSGALALVSEALFAKKFWELMVRLEVASLVSGNTIGCLLEEKAIRDKSKRVCTSHRFDVQKEKPFGS
ncbi:subtilisin-like protease 4 [Triticum aestivum]|uniref:subtilisin-like protease 4 n=1 Tax=Triticum aestivum TaxID=4565 RepID=UPI001D02F2CB|nr:subtilisin-like protease 4 [Triticum aestivum]